MRSDYRVADVLELHADDLNALCKTSWQSRTLHAIRKCRTEALGCHIDQCDCCQKLHLSYNSCRNRHCPTCQGHKTEQWITARAQELLTVPYFHVVFTLPSALNDACLKHPKIVYATLFKAAWETMVEFSKDKHFLGAKTGMIALLHTWGQNLSLHPHLHCIVPSGGVKADGIWKNSKNKGKFLFPVKAMSKVFRAKFVARLRKEKLSFPPSVFKALFSKDWVVYVKHPFKNTQTVIEYLGRYTHKIAISNHRIKTIRKNTVTFSVKNYRKGGKKELLTLTHQEFIRRLSLHILPKGFTRIRHYGILSSTWKTKHLKALQKQLNKPKTMVKEKSKLILHRVCPSCKKGKLKTILTLHPYRPPPCLTTLAQQLNVQNHG